MHTEPNPIVKSAKAAGTALHEMFSYLSLCFVVVSTFVDFSNKIKRETQKLSKFNFLHI